MLMYSSGIYFSHIFQHHSVRRQASWHVSILERWFSSTREFEEFQTNPITHVVQDAAAAETGKGSTTSVHFVCIRSLLRARILEILECECASHVRAPASAYAIHMRGTDTCLPRDTRIQGVARQIPRWIHDRFSVGENWMGKFDRRTEITR